MKKTCFVTSATAFLFLLAENVSACSVCKGGTSPDKLNAYVLTTLLLGTMPLIIGLILFFKIRGAYKAGANKNENPKG